MSLQRNKECLRSYLWNISRFEQLFAHSSSRCFCKIFHSFEIYSSIYSAQQGDLAVTETFLWSSVRENHLVPIQKKKNKNGEKYRSPEGQDNNLVVFFPSDPSLI